MRWVIGMVNLRRMTSAEFEAFAQYSVRAYAQDLAGAYGADAAEQARKEFSGMLPDGIHTPDNALMVIEAGSRAVGAIWYLFEVTNGVRHAFLCDFIIRPEERRKGYAAAALAEMERDALARGYAECRLYADVGNRAALNLYEKCGYRAFRQTADGIYMKKILNP